MQMIVLLAAALPIMGASAVRIAHRRRARRERHARRARHAREARRNSGFDAYDAGAGRNR